MKKKIDNLDKIEELLKSNGATPKKTQDIFELTIEIMQNMLNYSYGNKELPNNKKEANGTISLSYDSVKDKYMEMKDKHEKEDKKKEQEKKLQLDSSEELKPTNEESE